MHEERKSKEARKTSRFSPGCLVSIGVIIGFVVASSLIFSDLFKIGPSFDELELRSVLETYYFGDGLAELTGDTSILEFVVTETILQSRIEHCNKGLCYGSIPPHVIGEYFKVLRETDEFAVVELEERPIIAGLERKSGPYIRRCFSLVRDGDDWRVSGGYLNCDGYLPDKYK